MFEPSINFKAQLFLILNELFSKVFPFMGMPMYSHFMRAGLEFVTKQNLDEDSDIILKKKEKVRALVYLKLKI